LNRYRLAPDDVLARDELLLEAATIEGDVFAPLTAVKLGPRVTIYASADAIRFGEDVEHNRADAVRLGMSAVGQWKLLRELRMLLHTPRTVEATARWALKTRGMVGPFERHALGITSGKESMSTSAMVRHSDRIDLALAKAKADHAVVSAWKSRVLWTPRPGYAAHMGWFLQRGTPVGLPVHDAITEPDLQMVQDLERAHSAKLFADYSEFVDGFSETITLDGERDVDARDALLGRYGEDVARELSHVGVLETWEPDYASTSVSVQVPASPPAPEPRSVSAAARRTLRVMHPYMRGNDVETVQQAVGATVDGVYGPATERAVRGLQRGRGMPETGIVDAATWEAVDAALDAEDIYVDLDGPATDPAPTSSPAGAAVAELVDLSVPGRNFTWANRQPKDIQTIVVHSGEGDATDEFARNMARWMGGPSAPQASAHFFVGPSVIVAGVPIEHVAWAAPGMNRAGVQIEMAGRALRTDWTRGEGLAVMSHTAELVAALCRELEIPMVRVEAPELVAGHRGITTHDTVRRAFGRTTHVDPGGQNDKRWPWATFLELVRAA